jgi:hypothetical protein
MVTLNLVVIIQGGRRDVRCSILMAFKRFVQLALGP